MSPNGKFLARIGKIAPFQLVLLSTKEGFIRDLTTHQDLDESNPHWSGDGKNIAFQATQSFTQVDATGRARKFRQEGVWTADSEGKILRRVVKDAQLIGWIH